MTQPSTPSTQEAFQRAKESAGEGEVVCGYTDENGQPHYFVVKADATPEEMRARAFHAKHGRPMSRVEEMLDMALNGDLVRTYEEVMANYWSEEGDHTDEILDLLSKETADAQD